jgi:hypothetical protein
VREVGQDIAPLFAQVLTTCDRLGLIGNAMFAINEQWCQQRVDQLRKEAQATGDFINNKQPRLNVKGEEIKSNMTDADSAKMLPVKAQFKATQRRPPLTRNRKSSLLLTSLVLAQSKAC